MNSWDDYYKEDIENLNEAEEDVIPTTWFDDVKAPEKILKYLTSPDFPLAPGSPQIEGQLPTVMDLGTGNGQTLFQLLGAGYHGRMVGVDYSETSIKLARQLAQSRGHGETVTFDVMDVVRDEPNGRAWWPEGGFDLVLDKGTFDAISLSEEAASPESRLQHRINTLYPARAVNMVKPGSFLLITSCNWTQDELIKWFTSGKVEGTMEVFGSIEYPRFKFGGVEGQGVSTVCFKKTAETHDSISCG